jgi:hypothetical protein
MKVSVVFLVVGLLGVLVICVASNPFAQTSSKETSHLQPTTVPPLDTGVLTDPSGTYLFYNVAYIQNANNTTTMSSSMNLTSYEQLLHDPYSGFCHDKVQIVGTMAMITCTYPDSTTSS